MMEIDLTALVDHRVPVKEDKNRWCCEFREESANGLFHYGSEVEPSAFLEQGRNRAHVPDHVRQEPAVVTKIAK